MTDTERFMLLEQAAQEAAGLVAELPPCIACPRPATRLDGAPPKVRGHYCDTHAPPHGHDIPYAPRLRKLLSRLSRLGMYTPPR